MAMSRYSLRICCHLSGIVRVINGMDQGWACLLIMIVVNNFLGLLKCCCFPNQNFFRIFLYFKVFKYFISFITFFCSMCDSLRMNEQTPSNYSLLLPWMIIPHPLKPHQLFSAFSNSTKLISLTKNHNKIHLMTPLYKWKECSIFGWKSHGLLLTFMMICEKYMKII